jgi:predicted TIM-barrel fold metal-dependent hydrolase
MTRRDLLRAALPVAVALRSRAAEPAFERVDAHLHIRRVAPALLAAIEQAQWRCVSISVSSAITDDPVNIEDVLRNDAEAVRASKGRVAWASTFDARHFDSPGFAGRAIASLQESFKQGAIAVKIWKNVGMGIQSKSGEWVLPDNPVFSPIFEAIQKSGKPLIAHLGEPDGAWLPLDANNSERGYYSGHPEWHMLNKPGAPPKEAILAARDRVLARHPKLQVIGCHLGSDEEHWDRLAKRLDAFPNFTVDMAARVRYFARGDHEQARQFLMKYQDRILYATDFSSGTGSEEEMAQSLQRTWEQDWRFFATTETIESRGRTYPGLGLPQPVLRKLFRDNAVRLLPGIINA